MQVTQVPSLGREDPLEEGMAAHSSTLAWEIPLMEEPGGLQFMGSQRVGTRLSDFTSIQNQVYFQLPRKWDFSLQAAAGPSQSVVVPAVRLLTHRYFL